MTATNIFKDNITEQIHMPKMHLSDAKLSTNTCELPYDPGEFNTFNQRFEQVLKKQASMCFHKELF